MVEIKDDVVLVDVGKKLEGRLNAKEVMDEDENISCKVGDTIPVIISGFRNERPIVSHKKAIKKEKIKEFIANYQEDDDRVLDAKVVNKNRGGFIVEDAEGMEFFLPRSQAAVKDINLLLVKYQSLKLLR